MRIETDQKYLHQRKNGYYYFLMNVPKRAQLMFGSKQVWISLDTKSANEALVKVRPLVEEYKRKFQLTDTPATDINYEMVKAIVEKLSMDYHASQEIREASIRERVEMLSPAIQNRKVIKNPTAEVTAALGGAVEVPALTFKEAFKRFKEIAADKVIGMNRVETGRFWRRYEQPTEDFVKQMGDLDVLKIDVKKADEYRAKLVKRVTDGEFLPDAANHKILWLKIILDDVFRVDYPGKANPFRDVKKIKDKKNTGKKKRPALTEADVMAVRKAFATSAMSDEAKAICIIGEFTGCGAKELGWMTAADIHLEAPIPYISVRENDLRDQVKTGGERHRDLPLIGDALEAMKKFPNGFTRFHHDQGPTRLNRALSDFFRKVTPGKGHYSYRHRMATILKQSGCDLGLRASITGHTLKGNVEHYGDDYDLIQKKEAIEKAIEHAKKKAAADNTNNEQQNDMTDAKQAA